jgi:hypothetical protein
MELYKLPFIVRGIESHETRHAMALRFVKVHQRYGYQKAGAIMQSLATAINSLRGKIGTLVESDPTREDLVKQHDAICDLADVFDTQLRHKLRYLGYVRLIYQVKVKRALGTVRSLRSLRMVMSEINGIDWTQYLACVDWMNDNTSGVNRCDHCEDWEYTDKRRDALDGDMDECQICRSCVDNNFRYVDRYDRYVHHDDVRAARNADGLQTLIHYNDENFQYNEDHDFWAHVDYVPPPPPVIGRYHESKAYHRIIVDEWSKLRHRWFGVELEVEIKDHQIDKQEKARQLNDLINGGERGKRVFFEADGSLTNGFEIISQPMSLPAHHDLWQWLRDRDAVKYLLSHNTRTCGLHVHVNKDGLSQIQIAKVVTFINDPRNEQMVRAIARRYAEGYCKIKEKELSTAHASSDRYEAVNVSGRNTIEFRIFKGSLKYESVVAAIEFCNSLCNFAALSSTNDVASLTGDNFIDYINNDGAAESTTLRPYMNAVLQSA